MISAAFGLVWGFLKGLPWQVYAAVALACALWCAYHAGAQNIQNKWDAQNKADTEQAEKINRWRNVQSSITQIKYVDKIKVIHEKGETIYKLREQFVPTDSGMLSGAFRMFYDAAITNTIPDTAGIADAPSVSIADVADTHAYNAEQCNKAFAKLDGWREWATGQLRLNDEGHLNGR